MPVITRGRLRLAVGMEWSIPADKKDGAKFREDHKNDFLVRFKTELHEVIGSYTGTGKYELPLYAGALLVAQAEPNAIVVECISEESDIFWTVSIRDGVPNPTTDHVGTFKDVSNKYFDSLTFNAGATVVGTIKEATKSLDDVLSLIPRANLGKAKLHRSAWAKLAFKIVLIVLAGVTATWSGSSIWHSLKEKRMADQRAKDQENQRLLQEAMDKRVADEKHSVIAKQIAAFETGYSAATTNRVIQQIIDDTPYSIRGWQLTQVTCEMKDKMTCKAKRIAQRPIGSPEGAASIPGSPSALKDLIQSQIAFDMPSVSAEKTRVGVATKEDVLHAISAVQWIPNVTMTLVPTEKEVRSTVAGIDNKPIRIGAFHDVDLRVPYFIAPDVLSRLGIKGFQVSSMDLMYSQASDITVHLVGKIAVR